MRAALAADNKSKAAERGRAMLGSFSAIATLCEAAHKSSVFSLSIAGASQARR